MRNRHRSQYNRKGKSNRYRLYWVGVCKQTREVKVKLKDFWVVKAVWSCCLYNQTNLQTGTSGQRRQQLCQQTNRKENLGTVEAYQNFILDDSIYFLCSWKMRTMAYGSVDGYVATNSMNESKPGTILNEDILSTSDK